MLRKYDVLDLSKNYIQQLSGLLRSIIIKELTGLLTFDTENPETKYRITKTL